MLMSKNESSMVRSRSPNVKPPTRRYIPVIEIPGTVNDSRRIPSRSPAPTVQGESRKPSSPPGSGRTPTLSSPSSEPTPPTVGASVNPLRIPMAPSTARLGTKTPISPLSPKSRIGGRSANTPVARAARLTRGNAPSRIPSVLAVPGTGFPPVAARPTTGCAISIACATMLQKRTASGLAESLAATAEQRWTSCLSCAAPLAGHSTRANAATATARIFLCRITPSFAPSHERHLALATRHRPRDPRRLALIVKTSDDGVRFSGGHDQHHPHPHVEGAEHLFFVHTPVAHDHLELGRHRPARPVDACLEAVRDHPGQVLREAAAGNVRQGVDLPVLDQREDRLEVAPVHAQQHVGDRGIVLREAVVDAEAEPVEEEAPNQGIAIGVEAVGRQADEDVALPHPVLAGSVSLLHDPDDEPGQVVLARGV